MENIKMDNIENNNNEIKNSNRRKKRNRKMDDDEFIIPKIDEFYLLNEINYKTKQLQEICCFYKLKKSGNKNEIRNRVYDYLKKSNDINKIKKNFKGFLVRKIFKILKETSKNKNLCVNDKDFFTLDELKNLSNFQFFCFKDKDVYYGFDICSIYNLIAKTDDIYKVENPYTRNIINNNDINNVMKLVKYSKIIGIKMNIEIDNVIENISTEQKFRMNVFSLFQNIDELGHYTNVDWFLSLTKLQLILFIREILDIWNYRIDITSQQKKDILPPHGNLNIIVGNVDSSLFIMGELALFNLAYKIMNNLITRGVNRDSKYLGSIYILGSLTIVSNEAAIALPWLYETFRHNHFS